MRGSAYSIGQGGARVSQRHKEGATGTVELASLEGANAARAQGWHFAGDRFLEEPHTHSHASSPHRFESCKMSTISSNHRRI